MIGRDRGRASPRFLAWRIGLFCLAAGIWIAGLVSGRDEITAVATGLLLVSVVLGLVARRRPPAD